MNFDEFSKQVTGFFLRLRNCKLPVYVCRCESCLTKKYWRKKKVVSLQLPNPPFNKSKFNVIG